MELVFIVSFLSVGCSGSKPPLGEIPRPQIQARFAAVMLDPPKGAATVSEIVWGSSNLVASRFADGRFSLWQIGAEKSAIRIDSPVDAPLARGLAFLSPNRLATATGTGVILWDVSRNPAQLVSREDCGPVATLVADPSDGREVSLLAAREDGTLLRLGFAKGNPLGILATKKLDVGISRLVTSPGRVEFLAMGIDGSAWSVRTDLTGVATRNGSAYALAYGFDGLLVARLRDGPRVEVGRVTDGKISGTFSASRPANSIAILGSSSSLVVGGQGCLWSIPLGQSGDIPLRRIREISGYRGAVVVTRGPSGKKLAIGDGSGHLEIVDETSLASRGARISLDDVANLVFRPELRFDQPRIASPNSAVGVELATIRDRIDQGERFGQLVDIRKLMAREDASPRDHAEALALEVAIEARSNTTIASSLTRKILSARELFARENATDREADMEFWRAWLATPSFDLSSQNRDPQNLLEALTAFRHAAALYRAGPRSLERQALLCEAARSWIELNLGDIRTAARSFEPVAEEARADPVLGRVVELEIIASAIAAAQGDWARSASASSRVLDRLGPGERPELWRVASLKRAAALAALGSCDAAATTLSEERPNDPEWAIRRATCFARAGRAVRMPDKPVEGDPVAAHLRAIIANRPGVSSSSERIEDLALAASGHRRTGHDDLANEADLMRAEALELSNRRDQAAILYRELRSRINGIGQDPARRAARPILDAGPRLSRGLARMEWSLGRPFKSMMALEADGHNVDTDSAIGLSATEFKLAESLRDARARLESVGGYGSSPKAESAAIETRRLHAALAGHSGSTSSNKDLDAQSFGLENGEAILVISRTSPTTILGTFLDAHGEIAAQSLAVGSDQLDRDISHWRKTLGDGGRPVINHFETSAIGILGLATEPDLQKTQSGQKTLGGSIESRIHEAIIGPFAGRLQGVKTLYLVPDDSLSAMPLEAIGKEGRLGDTVSLRLLDRGSSLSALRDSARAERPSDRRAVLVSVEAGPASIARLSSLKKGWATTLMTAANATPDHLLADPISDCDIVHILAVWNADGSNLQLNPGEWPTRRDGEVSLSDLSSIPLRARVLILEVASLRETNPGSLRQLARSGLATGAESLILTLWKHPADSSARFFEAFYEAIASGRSPAEATVLARSSVARDPKFRDPIHWAGYAYYGP